VTTAVDAPRRRGRPPRAIAGEPGADGGTRERLLRAAVDTCVERGFERATVGDIARRADVTTSAIYNHFGGKADLLVEAARHELARLDVRHGTDPARVVRAFLSPGFAPTRHLLAELHLASSRSRVLADLLADWHLDQARRWSGDDPTRTAAVAAFFVLLLGCAQSDSLSALRGDPAALEQALCHAARVLLPGAREGDGDPDPDPDAEAAP